MVDETLWVNCVCFGSEFLGSIVANLLSSAGYDVGKLGISRLITSPLFNRNGGLPPNHDLRRASHDSLRAAALFALSGTAAGIGEKPPLLTAMLKEWRSGTLFDKPLFEIRDTDSHRWLSELQQGIRSRFEEFDDAIAFEDCDSETLLLGGASGGLKPYIHKRFLEWVVIVCESPTPQEFTTGLQGGWSLDNRPGDLVSFYDAYCLFFRECLKTRTEAFRAYVGPSLASLGLRIKEQKKLANKLHARSCKYILRQLQILQAYLKEEFKEVKSDINKVSKQVDAINREAKEEQLLLSKIESRYSQAQQARYSPGLCPFLSRYYGCPVLTRGPLQYPVYCEATTDAQSMDIESILGTHSFPSDLAEAHSPADSTYRNMLELLGKDIYNGRLYVMSRIHFGEQIQIDCSLGDYFRALATCDALEWELLECVSDVGCDDYHTLRSNLTLRNKQFALNPNPWTDGTDRCAALSISTLVVYNDGDYRALIRQRSGKTAAHADLYHVVPSFMMEHTWSESPADECKIMHQILREYLEELFGMTEMAKSHGQLSHEWFYGNPDAVELLEMIKSRRAELFLTGYTMNLLNLRPEISTLLVIHDEQWHKSGRLRNNWEFQSAAEAGFQSNLAKFTVPVNQTDEQIIENLRRRKSTFVPPGAGAFWLGMDRARRHLGFPRHL